MKRLLAWGLGLLWGVVCAAGWAQTVTHSTVEQVVEMRLHALLEELGTGLFVTALSAPTDLKLPDGEISWELGGGLEGWQAGRHTLPVTVSVEGARAARIQVAVTVKQRVQVPVLLRDYKRGELVEAGDVQLREWELSAPLSGRLRNPEDAVGKAVNRDVRTGQVLLEKWLEEPVVVKRGDRVRVTLIRGGLKIETSGVAMQPGRIGEHISLRNTESKSLYEAQIIAPGQAQVRSW
ncbi:MAG: flagellar basal body P-ring formation protein FlgA [Magnetococcales bacterium]|nr:flagellar basal body P-ring formation protein FlgA [Magnetococcales bacterium]